MGLLVGGSAVCDVLRGPGALDRCGDPPCGFVRCRPGVDGGGLEMAAVAPAGRASPWHRASYNTFGAYTRDQDESH